MNILSPDAFELIELEDEKVEAIVVNKQLLSRIPGEKLISVLHEKVFPYISRGEMVRVDVNIRTSVDEFEINIS